MVTLCLIVSLMGQQPSAQCMQVNKTRAVQAAGECVTDPLADCTVNYWSNNGRYYVILTVTRWTP